MARARSGGGKRATAEQQLREAFRAVEGQPVPDRLKAHLDALTSAVRKDRRA